MRPSNGRLHLRTSGSFLAFRDMLEPCNDDLSHLRLCRYPDPRTNRNARQLLGGVASPLQPRVKKLAQNSGHSKHSTLLICRSDMTINYGFYTPINKQYQCDSFYADPCVRSRYNLLCIKHRLSRLFSPTVILSRANLGLCY
jgi:hypothetical protein